MFYVLKIVPLKQVFIKLIQIIESIWERILYSKDKYIGGLKDGLT